MSKDFSLIMIRGPVGRRYHWYGFDKALQHLLDISHVQFIDMPPQPSTWKEALHYKNTKASMSHHNINTSKPFHLLATSLGALTAFHLLQSQHNMKDVSKQCQSLCLINPSHRQLSSLHQRFSPLAVIHLFCTHLLSRSCGEKTMLKLAINRPSIRKSIKKQALTWQETKPWTYKALISQLLFHHKHSRHLPSPKDLPPTLILSGAKDRLVSPKCSLALAEYLHAPHMIHPAAGHDLTTEDPQWCLHHLKVFYDPFLKNLTNTPHKNIPLSSS